MRTQDLNEAVEVVGKVFCPHTVKVLGRSGRFGVRLDVKHPAVQPMVRLGYGASVRIDTTVSRFLMMHCFRGAATAVQNGRVGEWRAGQTMPLSVGLETALSFDEQCVQDSVMLDMGTLQQVCARWLGEPLGRPLTFEPRPFSHGLEQTWRRALAFIWSQEGSHLALSAAAKTSFDEFLITLLLHHHPHQLSARISEPVSTPVPSLVRRAERYMAENAASPITVSDVAEHLGVSVRTLQAGFRDWRNATPSAALRRIRLQSVRRELSSGEGGVTVTSVALQHGFAHLGRFSGYYSAEFGETPHSTLRRNRSVAG